MALNKIKGCLIGGAVGDALGYTVEFNSINQIYNRFGKDGITEYSLHNGIAEFSDDTQMTLFTAVALESEGKGKKEEEYIDQIASCYRDWYKTQTCTYAGEQGGCWLLSVSELYSSRAPGTTCLSAISQGCNGSTKNRINKSKGCGGIMRVAPVSLFFTADEIQKADRIAAEAAALTHGHALGFIPAAGLSHIVNLAANCPDMDMIDIIDSMTSEIKDMFAREKHIEFFSNIIEKAIELAKDPSDEAAKDIAKIGEGWVAEEALAIAIYCVLRYPDDFEKCIIAAVNHSGDSDSTGAIAGNIIGAYLGYDKIPAKFTKRLELHDLIVKVATDMVL